MSRIKWEDRRDKGYFIMPLVFSAASRLLTGRNRPHPDYNFGGGQE